MRCPAIEGIETHTATTADNGHGFGKSNALPRYRGD